MSACHHRARVAAVRHLLREVRTADDADLRSRQTLLQDLAHEPKPRLDALRRADYAGASPDKPVEFRGHLPERRARHGNEHDIAHAKGVGKIRGRVDAFCKGVAGQIAPVLAVGQDVGELRFVTHAQVHVDAVRGNNIGDSRTEIARTYDSGLHRVPLPQRTLSNRSSELKRRGQRCPLPATYRHRLDLAHQVDEQLVDPLHVGARLRHRVAFG